MRMKEFATTPLGVFCIAIILFPFRVYPIESVTQTIRGRVIDSQTFQPLPGANVILPQSDPFQGTATNESGYFVIREVEIGRIDVKMSYMGYKDVILSDVNHISGRETILNIEMDEVILKGKEVVISASRDKSESVNPLISISSRGFTVEETERFAGSRNDVARMASNYAGVVGLNDSRNDIVVRGNSPGGLSWRLEGIDIPSPNHWAAFGSSGGPVNMLNNNLLSNSDFLTGAFPAEYGNAFASVFDLRMRNGNDQKYEFLGQVGFNGFELGAEGPLMTGERSSYLVNARYSTMEVFDMLGVDFGTSGVPKYSDMSYKLHFPETRAGSFSFFGLGGRSRISMLYSNRDKDSETPNYYAGEGTDLVNGADMVVAGMNYLLRLNNNMYIRSTLAYSYRNTFTRIDSLILPDLTPFNIYGNDFGENRFSGAFALNARLDSRNFLKTGMQISNRILNLADSTYSRKFNQMIIIRDMEGSGIIMQPYAHWQHKFNEKLVLNAGIHSIIS